MFPFAYSMRQTDCWTLFFQSISLMQTRVSCSLCSHATEQMGGRGGLTFRPAVHPHSTLAAHQQVPQASWAAWNSSCHSSQSLQAPAIRASYPPRALCIEAQARPWGPHQTHGMPKGQGVPITAHSCSMSKQQMQFTGKERRMEASIWLQAGTE